MTSFPQFGGSNDQAANEQRLHHVGRIPYATFQGVIGGFFGLSVVAVAARMAIRVHTHRFSLDDYFLLFGLASLSGATGLVLRYSRSIFIIQALATKPNPIVFTYQDIMDLTNAAPLLEVMGCLIWASTFSVKFSFLVLFRLLIRRMSRNITVYYWVLVAFTTLSWAFMTSLPFIFCPFFGINAIKCSTRSKLSLPLNTLSIILDITTDIMSTYARLPVTAAANAFPVVSIPIIILRKSQMKYTQKLGLGAFLCMSVVMVLIAIIQISGYRDHGYQLDSTWFIWRNFWVYLEACIATIMASIAAFRTIFVHKGSKKPERKINQTRLNFIRERILRKPSGWEEVDREYLPKIPSATLTVSKPSTYSDGSSNETTAVMQSTLYSGDEEDQMRHEMIPDHIDRIEPAAT